MIYDDALLKKYSTLGFEEDKKVLRIISMRIFVA